MPIAVSPSEVVPGMQLARAVRNQYSTLLTNGTILNDDAIGRLGRIQLDDAIMIRDPLLDAFVEFDDPSIEQEAAVRVHREMVATLTQVEESFRRSTVLKPGDFINFQQSLADVVQSIQNSAVHSAFLIKTQSADEYQKFHSANVFYLAMLLGREMRDYIARERIKRTASNRATGLLDLTPLGQAALLHDIGLLTVGRLGQKTKRLSPEESEQIRNHPTAGADLIPESGSPVLRTVIRQHHELADGTGYPKGRRLEETHVFSRIVRVADAFDTATSRQRYRQALLPCRVLYDMTTGPWRHLYDATLTKVFLSVIQPFDIGARLKLSTGQYGIVVKHNARRPFAPVVIAAFDGNGKRLPKEQLRPPIDLSADTSVRLEAFGRESLGYLYRSPALSRHVSPAEAKNLFDLSYP